MGSAPELTPDVLVIGLGINGAATFRDLALQGVDVIGVDRGDVCEGSSAAPSRMIHGGLRYLEFGEVRLVRESLRERDLLLANAPHRVTPLPTVIPLRNWTGGVGTVMGRLLRLRVKRPARRGALAVLAGLVLYDRFSTRHRVMPTHRFVGRRRALERWPGLPDDIVGVARYHDARVSHPERLGLELVLDGCEAGGRVLTHTSVASGADGILALRGPGGVTLVRPRVVVNAAGPWIDDVNAVLTGERTGFIGGTKGSHLVLDHPDLHRLLADEMLYHETPDGRTSLLLPLHGHVIVGTTDIPVDDADDAVTTHDEVEYLLAAANGALPGLTVPVARCHVVATFVGVRPLPAVPPGIPPGQVSRDHSLPSLAPTADRPHPIHSMVGGKWTTFRAFAESTTDVVLADLGVERRVATAHLAIGGGRDHPDDPTVWVADLAARTGLDPDRVATLFARYGTRAAPMAEAMAAADDTPLTAGYWRSEIAWMVNNELVVTLDDVIRRRTTIGLLGRATPEVVAAVAEVVGDVLDWDADHVSAQVADVHDQHRDQH